MDRRARIIRHIPPGSSGIEVGPSIAPLLPKAEGWRVLVLDVYPADELRRLAGADATVPRENLARIEPVDLLGPAQDIAELAEAAGIAAGSLDFVVSSHNFEHIPDPIRFLRGVERLLRPGGVLSMAVPDRRLCFDLLRPRSTLGAMLEAWFERRAAPTARQVFETEADRGAVEFADLCAIPECGVAPLRLANPLDGAFAAWQRRRAGEGAGYVDTHCWALTPRALELILRDLAQLGLIGLETVSAGPIHGLEFDVHLRKPAGASTDGQGVPSREALFAALLAEEAEHRAAALQRRIGELQARVEVQQREMERMEAQARAQLSALLSSRSWRATRPLRALAQQLRQWKR